MMYRLSFSEGLERVAEDRLDPTNVRCEYIQLKNSIFGEVGKFLRVLMSFNNFDTEGQSFFSISSHTAASELLDKNPE